MAELILTTLDWVPDMPRGYVRDIRVRWALEEAGFAYRVEGTPLEAKTSEHYIHQPFGQVPWLEDGDVTLFESGAILDYLGGKSEALLPSDPKERDQAKVWMYAALNSVEAASLPWAFFKFMKDDAPGPGRQWLDDFVAIRLHNLERVLARRKWLVDSFSVADILMADVLRLIDRFGGLEDYPACAGYLARATARPAFTKAFDDQIAFFAAADERRGKAS
ncbi:glutathione S-transferase family protein [Luteibacter sp. CQ10]|uniref:glutathione S-transferase family protein n=1 Tax=Luteibacter sp. CQ10 TaxID=2805821 RepID=UPI0034A1AA4E